jgi:outer membrane protein assembly factor BamB
MRKMPLQSAIKKRLALAGISFCLCVTLFLSCISIGSVGVSLLSGFKPTQSGPYLYLHGPDDAVYVLNAYSGSIHRQYNLNYRPDVNPNFSLGNVINDHGILYYEGYRGVYAARLQDGSLLWKRYLSTVPFGSVSLLAVIGGTLFAQSNFMLYALHVSDGVLLWQYDLSKDFTAEKPSPVPLGSVALLAVVDGTLFVQSDFMLYALHASDGVLLWQHDLSKDFTAEESFLIKNVLITNGVLCFTSRISNKEVYALFAIDSHSGSFLWKQEIGGYPDRSLLADGVFYVASDTTLHAYRLRDGFLLWKRKGVNGISSVAVSEGLIIVRDTRNIYALRTSDQHFVWFYTENNGDPGNLLISKDTVYTNTLALRIDNGQLLWRRSTSTLINSIDDSIDDKNIFYSYRAVTVSRSVHIVYLEAIQRSSGAVVWQQKIEVAYLRGAMISHGIIFLLNYGFICAYAASTGQFLWQQNLDFGPSSQNGDSSLMAVNDG